MTDTRLSFKTAQFSTHTKADNITLTITDKKTLDIQKDSNSIQLRIHTKYTAWLKKKVTNKKKKNVIH